MAAELVHHLAAPGRTGRMGRPWPRPRISVRPPPGWPGRSLALVVGIEQGGFTPAILLRAGEESVLGTRIARSQSQRLMDQPLPSFRKPPVIETALSVQFQPLKRMSNAHLGLFWNRVRATYPKLHDADPIEPQIERFGSDLPRARFPQLRIAASHPAARLRMSSEDGHVMLQLQNGRLVSNWRRLDGGNEYPRWTQVEPQFQAALRELKAFAEAEELGSIEPNQWEVTYLNHLVRGREWNGPADWQEALPGVIGTTSAVSVGRFETMGSHTHFALPNDAGRLHVELTHGFSGPDEDADELLIVQLTARGGIDESRDVSTGLALGREAIVRSFAEIAGKRVRTEVWEQEATVR